MTEPGQLPEGFTVDAVDWLPSGARSGLVRVRGHRPAAVAGPLPELILDTGPPDHTTRRFLSLPDPRADRDPTAWRGAYVLEAKPAAEADRLWLEWPGSRRIELPPLSVPPAQVARSEAAPEEDAAQADVVVDRAVLAERRARRAEASEQAQAKIAREALRAVEVLELRIAELEQRAAAAEGERDALRSQAEPDVGAETLHQEIAELRAELARRRKAPAPATATAGPERIPAGEAERRAERLRSALTATVATVGELRLRLHEVQVARRTRDLAAAADSVRLAVVDRERGALKAALDEARTQLERAVAARDEAVAELQGVRNAHDDLRNRFGDVSAELGSARERIADLESEVAAVTALAERSADEAFEAARAEAAALATEQAHDAEAEMKALRARMATAEASIAAAESARELAEARALAATTNRLASAVAEAATPRPSPREPASAPPPRVPDALIVPAPAPAPGGAAERIAADLDAARDALRAVEPPRQADPEPVAPDPVFPSLMPAPGPVGPAEPVTDEQQSGPTIISATGQLPNDLARGRSTREFPPLRGALVKLAHDDPAAAGRILAGFLRAQHAALTGPAPDYDLTIAEVGTFAVSQAGQTTLVNPIDAPRGRGQAAFHLTIDALTLAESVSGVATKPRRRRGPVRVSGKARQARRLADGLRHDVSIADLVAAGAELDPGLTLRGFAYAVRPAWIQGQRWRILLLVGDDAFAVDANHTGGLTISAGAGDGEPDARVRLTAAEFRALVAGDLAEPRVEGDERVFRRLLSLAERARTGAE